MELFTWLRGDILVKADKMAMANSLELRVPFLDTEVFAVASGLPPDTRGCRVLGPDAGTLVRREVAAAEEIDPARPCSRQAPAQGPADAAPSGITARFDRVTNTIALTAGENATLTALAEAVQDPPHFGRSLPANGCSVPTSS